MPSKKRKLHSNNTTGYRGVFKSGDRLRAQIFVNKKKKYLGTYETPKEAAIAYDQAVIKYNQSKDKLNWPDGYPKITTKKKNRKLLLSPIMLLGIHGVHQVVERGSKHRSVVNKNNHISWNI